MSESADKAECEFETMRFSGWRLVVNKRRLGSLCKGAAAGSIEDNIRGPFEEVCASKYARVWRCAVSFRGERVFYVKEFLYRSVWDFLKHLFRRSRARRALAGSKVLEEIGLRSPEVIAAAEKRFGGVCLQNVLVSEAVEGAEDLYEVAKRWAAGGECAGEEVRG